MSGHPSAAHLPRVGSINIPVGTVPVMPEIGRAEELERVTLDLSRSELDDLIIHVRTGTRLRPGQPRQQRLLAKLRGFGPSQTDADDEPDTAVCPLERDTPDDVGWLAGWVHGRLHELTDGDDRAVVWKQAHLVRFLLGRMHDYFAEQDQQTLAVSAFMAEGQVAHIARYLEHAASCDADELRGSRRA